jgi:hypothetical protein
MMPMEGVQQAHRWAVRFCGSCPFGHVVFVDERGLPICEAVLSAFDCERMAADIRNNDPNFRTGGPVEVL